CKTNIVQSVQQAMLAERVDIERKLFAARLHDDLALQIDFQLIAGSRFNLFKQRRYLVLGQNDGQQTVLEAVVEKNVSVRRRDDGTETKLHQGPGRMFAARSTTEIFSGQQNGSTLITRLVKHEIRVQGTLAVVHAGLTMIQIAQFVEQVGAKTRALDGLQELLGNDEVGINIGAVQRRRQAFVRGECLHDGILSELTNVDEMAGDGSGGSHGGAHQMRTPALALTAFEVPV